MEIKDQLIDSGAVIGYRPDLKYEKSNSVNESNIDITNEYVNNNRKDLSIGMRFSASAIYSRRFHPPKRQQQMQQRVPCPLKRI